MKKLLSLFFVIVCCSVIAAKADILSMQECDDFVMASDVCGCAAPVSTPCDTGNEVTCKMPICNLCDCECKCPCFKITKEEIYKKLCLSPCQVDRANALYDRYKCDTQCIRDSLKCEQDKLCELKKRCAEKCQVAAHEKKLKELQKRLKCLCKDFEKDFLCVLTSEQQICYKTIKKEEKSKCKKSKCCNTCK